MWTEWHRVTDKHSRISAPLGWKNESLREKRETQAGAVYLADEKVKFDLSGLLTIVEENIDTKGLRELAYRFDVHGCRGNTTEWLVAPSPSLLVPLVLRIQENLC